MNNYNENKKVRRIASVVYVLFMLFVVIGTTLSEHQKAAVKNDSQDLPAR